MSSNDLNNLAKGTIINFTFGIIGSFLTLIFNILAANYFGPDNFGIFTLLQTFLIISVIFASLGIPGSVARYYTYYKNIDNKKFKGFVFFSLIVPLISSLIVGILLFLLSNFLSNFFNLPYFFSSFLKIISFLIPIKVLSSIFENYILGEKKYFHRVFSYNIINKIALLIGIFLIIYFKLELIYLIYTFVFSILLQFSYILIIILINKKKIFIKGKKEIIFKEWIKFSLPLFFIGLVIFFYNWADKLIIAKFLNETELGIYSVAFSIAMFLSIFRNNLAVIFTPIISQKVASKKYKEINFLYKKSNNWIVSLSIPIFFVIIFFSKNIISILYNKEYINAYLPLSILSLGMLIKLMLGLNRELLISYGKSKIIFLNNLFAIILNITLNLILIPYFGIIGVAIATSISFIVENLYLYLKVKKELGVSLDYIYYLKFIIAGIPSILIGSYLFKILDINVIIDLVIAGTVYGLVYIFLLIALRIFDKEDIKILLLIEKKLGINLKLLKRILKKIV